MDIENNILLAEDDDDYGEEEIPQILTNEQIIELARSKQKEIKIKSPLREQYEDINLLDTPYEMAADLEMTD